MVNIDEDQIVEEEVVLDEEEETTENSEVSEESEEPEKTQDEEDDEEDRIVSIGDSVPEEETEDKPETPLWVKKVRKVNRKLESENKLLKRQLEAKATLAETEKPVEIGEKPTLASVKYDDSAYEKELISYYDRKRKVEDQAAVKAKTVEVQNEAWQVRQRKYADLKLEHSFKDFGETEKLVSGTFSQAQQSIIVQGAEDSALLVYALGKNPKKLEELAKITNPVDFAFKVAKLESQLKVTSRKAPPPEKKIKSGKAGGMSGNSDRVLEQLRVEADKSGDYTKIRAHNQKLRDKDK